jgi:hypothetical protein
MWGQLTHIFWICWNLKTILTRISTGYQKPKHLYLWEIRPCCNRDSSQLRLQLPQKSLSLASSLPSLTCKTLRSRTSCLALKKTLTETNLHGGMISLKAQAFHLGVYTLCSKKTLLKGNTSCKEWPLKTAKTNRWLVLQRERKPLLKILLLSRSNWPQMNA